MSECFLSVVLIEMRQDRFLARGLFLSRNVSFLSFLRGSVVGAMFLKCVFELGMCLRRTGCLCCEDLN